MFIHNLHKITEIMDAIKNMQLNHIMMMNSEQINPIWSPEIILGYLPMYSNIFNLSL